MEIFFEIVDPTGKSNRNAGLVNIVPGRGSIHFIDFKGLGAEALNKGLDFLKLVSKYNDWESFLTSDERRTYSIKAE